MRDALKDPKGDPGTNGSNGTNGTNGTNGATNVIVKHADVAVTGGIGSNGVGCPAGQKAVGGGGNSGGGTTQVTTSAPSADGGLNAAIDGQVPNGWFVQIDGTGTTTGDVYVVCAAP